MEKKIKEAEELLQQAEKMYYVAKIFRYSTPSIVEEFENAEMAQHYAGLMTSANKGVFVVLTVTNPNYKQ